MSSLLASLPSGSTPPLSRLHTLSRSFRHGSMRYRQSGLPTILERGATRNNVTRTASLDNRNPNNKKDRLSMTTKDLGKHDEDRKKLMNDV